ncbi:hypothetical protein SVIO_059460 [Streptomyces violaceusniger]|uniref:Uncharacterized protein n=1 Tax=Streptomyces violaceusniger TaxID=68280 RepID=A0A4D4LB59_STRVO|nr:hypothetical protein SVIO_059460 [Streptomyces violaceusniger]
MIDEATSLLAARLFHGGPPEPGPDWSPVDWGAYPEEVVDRKWRQEAARLNRLLDERDDAHEPIGAAPAPASASAPTPATLARVMDRLTAAPSDPADGTDGDAPRLAARLSVEVAREEAAATRAHGRGPAAGAEGPAGGSGGDPWIDGFAPVFPLQPPRTGRELLADHVTAMVCCAAVDTAGAAPGLDWLDGPALLVGGRRRADLAHPVLSLVEDGDDGPLRAWLGEVGVRPEKPVRLV